MKIAIHSAMMSAVGGRGVTRVRRSRQPDIVLFGFLSTALGALGCRGEEVGFAGIDPLSAYGADPSAISAVASDDPRARSAGLEFLGEDTEPPSVLVGSDKATGYMKAAGVAAGVVGTPVPFPPQGATDAKLAYASQAVANFDVDNDGLADMVFSSSITRKLRYYRRLSATVADFDLGSPHDIDTVLPAGGDPRPAVAGDVTGDGKVDIILSLAGSGSTDPAKTTLYLYTNLGNATFSRTAITTGLTPSSYPSGLVGKTLWDLNADGKLDLIVYAPIGTSTAAQLQVFMNVGGATPFNSSNRTAIAGAAGTLLGTSALWGGVTAADFDHDGKGDLIVLGPNKKLWFLKGVGSTAFTIPPSPIQILSSLNFGAHVIDRVATDSDDLTDLVLTPAYSGADKPLLIFRGQGNGTTFSATPDQTIANWGTNVAPLVEACRFLPNGASCDDNTVCNGREICFGGLCRPGPALPCGNPDDPCMAGSCDPVTGCTVPSATGQCDDQNECTDGDHCDVGACVGVTVHGSANGFG